MIAGHHWATEVTTIVFDMTGVITRSPIHAIQSYIEAAGAKSETVMRHLRNEDFRQVLLGARSMQQHVSGIAEDSARTDGVELSPERLLAAMRVGQEIDPEVASLIDELGLAYRLAVLTNNTSDVVDTSEDGSPAWWSDTGGLALKPSDFELVMSSSDLGLVKPDVAIYRELLSRLGVPAGEVAYIDDQADNLLPAAALGMKTVHFSDVRQCRADLRNLGIVVGAG